MSKKIQHIVLAFFGILVLNFLGSKNFKRFDLTKDKRYTLSEVSKNSINSIDKSLFINVYLEGKFPAEFQRLQIETQQFLEELQAENSNIRFRFVNPDHIKNALVKKGMMPSQLTVEEDGTLSEAIIFPWAEIIYNNKTELVPLLPNSVSSSQEQQLQNAIESLEFSFINGLNSIIKNHKKNIAIISGKGELEDIKLYSFLSELSKKYTIKRVHLDTDNNQPNVALTDLQKFDLAIISKPTKTFSAKEKLTLDQFIINGGKSLWMIDNLYADTDSLYNAGKMMAYPRDLNLTDLLFSYGIRINNKLVKDLYASKLTLAAGNVGNQPQFESFNWFYHPLVTGNPNHPTTKNTLPIRLRFTTQIDTLKNNIKKTPLLVSSPLTKLVGVPQIIELSSIADEPTQEEYSNGPQLLAVLLEGEFTSAYNNRTLPYKLDNFKTTSNTNKMVVIADGDIAKNQTLKGQPYDLSIDKWTQQRFGNKDFLVNTVDYLLDDSGLIYLRNKKLQLNTLNKQKTYSEQGFWQFINVALPISLLLLFGFIFNYLRKNTFNKS